MTTTFVNSLERSMTQYLIILMGKVITAKGTEQKSRKKICIGQNPERSDTVGV